MSLVRPGCLPSMEGTSIFQILYFPRHMKSVSHLWADMLNKASMGLWILLFQISAGLCRQCAADKLRQHATWVPRQGV